MGKSKHRKKSKKSKSNPKRKERKERKHESKKRDPPKHSKQRKNPKHSKRRKPPRVKKVSKGEKSQSGPVVILFVMEILMILIYAFKAEYNPDLMSINPDTNGSQAMTLQYYPFF